ncbi:serine/threonine-protein phosphatase 2A regulatory subunit B'' subunit gamma-like [Daphnia pulex]|uniref:serine/threonine-protein phosphatase 2A regulatory subunit B'' subunit gamma-like n=1 Tax=Daphnia pulex TaxID=6669 RepID=UPI001EDF881F|nr:serine/threonine-protein phosphatase 2A regulatory subunit B'' subunit gamma-like [Daphnia pulex]
MDEKSEILVLNAEDEDTFQKLYSEGLKYSKQCSEESMPVPKFYTKLPNHENMISLKLREEARTAFLQKKSKELLDNNELQNLWTLLDKNHSPPAGSEQMINYIDFLKVGNIAGPKYKAFFTPDVFARLLQNDIHGRISTMAVFNYIMRKVWLQQTRIGLSLYDATGQGLLTEMDLENYITELIPTLPQLEGLEKSFHSFYVCTAVRKFLFFLDPLKLGKVRIQDILASGFLDELLELRDEELPKDAQDSNWFSAPSALRVYGQYLNLDTNRNGMLCQEELRRFGTGTLTRVFIQRVFEECMTYEKEMDYKTYLDFVLAMDNKKEPQALQYFFRLLDVNHRNHLNTFDLHFYFKGVQELMQQHKQEVVAFDDVNDEIFDMVRPADPSKITLHDLINCGYGETVINILIDLDGFWTYENREAVVVTDKNNQEKQDI